MAYNINDAFLADKVYETQNMARGTVLSSPDGTRWVLELKSPDRNDGYQGALFRNADTGEFKFASRGTEPLREPLRDLVIANLQLGFQVIPDQMVSQRLFFERAQSSVRDQNINPATITLVGDSLGGSLVTLLGVENPQNPVHAFNPYGVGNLVPAGSYSNITSHVFARDPVVVLPGSKTVGVTYMYNEPDNPRGSTTPALASHTDRSLWQVSAVGAQLGTTIVVDAFTPMQWIPAPAGRGLQITPPNGLPWPSATDVTAKGNGYNPPGTSLAGAGRGFINPDVVTPPADLGTSSRNSADYVTETRAHHVTISRGGTLSDLWLLQKNSPNGFASAREFYAAVLAGNRHITNVDDITAGTTIHVPQRTADGSFTYTFDNGYQCTTHPVSGEFTIRVPNGLGGFVTYARESADEMGYTVRRTTQNAQGSILEEVTGYQTGLSAWAPSRLDRSSFSLSTVQQCRRLFKESQYSSPLILDLDGNGIVATRELGKGAFFDHEGDGLAESTGWVGSGDALLVRDLNGNGHIDNGNELFGNQTDLHPGVRLTNAANGFAALATLDTNRDGQVSAQDGSGWSSLLLWNDFNGNGRNEAGELIRLQDAGIDSLGTTYSQNASPADAQGNEHRQLGRFTRSDGSTGAMHDVWFATDAVIQRDADPVAVGDVLAALPDMQGLGDVRSLRQTMARDASGRLQSLVQAFMAGDGQGGPGTRAQAEAILQAWTGADQVSGMRGTVDARKVAALEALMADTYYNVNWSSRDPIRPVQTDQVHQAYDALLADLYAKLLAQTQFRPLLASVAWVFGADGSLSVDVQAIRALLQDKYTQSPVATEQLMTLWGQSLMGQGVRGRQVFDALVASGSPTGTGFEQVLARMGFEHVTGTATDDVLTAAAGDQPSLLRGGEGNDQVTGSAGNDVLEGGEGADTLEGGLGSDLLVGAAGNDVLRGGQGDDSYVYTGGGGIDTIIDFESEFASTEHALGGTDTLFLRGGILASQTQAFREDDDLVLQFGPRDSIRVVGHFVQGRPGGRAGWMERAVFEDGTQWSDWSTVTVRKRVYFQFGSSADEAFSGGAASDEIRAGAGNDIITGNGGEDALYGEEGDDVISGRGTLDGGAGNDSLRGSGYRDTLAGGAGNDTLYGGGGDYSQSNSDTYLFNLGDGVDTVVETLDHNNSNTDTLRFGAGIAPTDVAIAREGNHLELRLATGADKVIVQDWYTSTSARGHKLEQVQFADGTLWTGAQLGTWGLVANGTDSADTLIGLDRYGDALNGLGGNDVLIGGNGNDTLAGGAGTDTLYGGGGNYSQNNSDTYLFNLGDGVDTVVETLDYNNSNTDTLRFGAGIAPADVAVVRVGNHLELRLANGVDKVIVQDWFATASVRGNKLEQVQFADRTTWTPRDLQSIQTGVGVTVTGSGDLRGTAAADTLTANGYGTSLQGGAGNDILTAQQTDGLVWNLTYNGGQGNDQITGSYAKDTYVFNRGDGWDTISDDLRFYPGTSAPDYFAANPNAPEYQDQVQFGPAIDASQLWFQRTGDDLQVSLVGETDGMTITGWYASMFREIEEFRLSDGRMLRNEDVNALVQAMAAFSPPPAGQTHLSQDYQSVLEGVLAANWR